MKTYANHTLAGVPSGEALYTSHAAACDVCELIRFVSCFWACIFQIDPSNGSCCCMCYHCVNLFAFAERECVPIAR